MYIYIYIYIYELSGFSTKSNLSAVTTGLNSEISFSKTNYNTQVKESSLLYYLPIAKERIVGLITFPKVLTLCERQTASFMI